MTSKYYTPNISEFHVGFEYIENDTNVICGIDYIYGSDTVGDILLEGNIKVKYLDKEDILSLDLLQTTIEDVYEKKVDSKRYRILYYGENKYKIMEKFDGTLFIGTIKNKSELIKLLIQLGI